MTDDEKLRGPEYVPDGPVCVVPHVDMQRTIAKLSHNVAALGERIAVLEAQVRSIQVGLPKGIRASDE